MTVHPELVPKVVVEAARYPSLVGKGVIVTGGGSGIGAGIVEHFAGQGCKTGFIELSADYAKATADAIEASTGNRPHFAVADLRDVAALKAAIAEALQDAGEDVQRRIARAMRDAAAAIRKAMKSDVIDL